MLLVFAAVYAFTLQGVRPMSEVRFMTLDPGHFHAGLVQKEMYPGVSGRVDVYAPLGADLLEHLNRIVGFNTRKENPTAWNLEVHTGPDFLERMLREKPGNVVVLSGRNLGKIDRIKASVEAGLNVLSDKPWIIEPADLPKLESTLATADRKKLVAYDIMTERYEITTMLQRALVNDKAVFGTQQAGTVAEPGVFMESVHHLLKMVAGRPNLRPAWFFDVRQQGEGLPDVGTHLVDLVQWILLPEQALDYRKDIRVQAAKRWPTVLSRAEFQKVTGEQDFPASLRDNVSNDRLQYYCNTLVSYAVRGVQVKLNVLWNYEAPPGGGDTHFAYFRGSQSRVEIRQGKAENYRPELYVVPTSEAESGALLTALRKRIVALQSEFPGVELAAGGKELHIKIPDKYRVGHEAHFAQVTSKFLGYLKNPASVPAWERPNMLAKYYVTTQGLQLSRETKGE
jgi:predicted dehydrogenase